MRTSLPNLYASAESWFTGRRRNPNRVPWPTGKATHAHRFGPGERIAVRYHNTDVVTIYPLATPGGERLTLNSGGFRTVTTRGRMNEVLPAGWTVRTNRGVWSLRPALLDSGVVTSWPFADGITIHPDGAVTGAGAGDATRLVRRIDRYVRTFTAEFAAGRIDPPGSGDCLFCALYTEQGVPLGDAGPVPDTEHLDAHMRERYFVPSLLTNAAREVKAEFLLNYVFPAAWGSSALDTRAWLAQARPEVARVLRRYLKRQFRLQG